MGKDKEMPSLLGLLHGRFATPHWGILVLTLISIGFGMYGVLDIDKLTQITLASNTGTFLVYGMTNAIVLVAFWSRAERNAVKHIVVPGLGTLANVGMLFAILYLNITSGGSTASDTVIALGIVVVWIVAGVVWLVVNSARTRQGILTQTKAVEGGAA